MLLMGFGEVQKCRINGGRRRLVHLAGVAVVLAVISVAGFAVTEHQAWAQTARTIKVVVPFPPGGTADILARVVGEQIGRAQNVSVLIENRPGAGAIIGTEAVAHAAPDGNTLLITSASNFVITPHLRKLNYDPLNSFEPICNLIQSPQVIVANSASPYRTLADLLDAARAKPGVLTLAGTGPATASHIAFETLKRAANVNLIFVPYPGQSPVVAALLGEHVTAAISDVASLAEQLKAGKLRALAAASRKRTEPLPELPTVAESGYPDFAMDVWFGLFAPAATPKETVLQLAGWFTAAMRAPAANAKLVLQGLYPVGVCGADFAALLRKQHDDYGRIIREANIRAE